MWECRRQKGSFTNMWKQIAMGTGNKVRKVMPKEQKKSEGQES